jgi:hypothetical protein
MVCFPSKYTHLGKFWRALDWKMFICLMSIRNILQAFGIFYDVFGTFCVHLVDFFRFLVSCAMKNLATPVRTHDVYVQCRNKAGCSVATETIAADLMPLKTQR